MIQCGGSIARRFTLPLLLFALTFLFATAEDVFVFFAGVFVLGLDLDLAFAFGLGDADLALGDADRPLGEVDLLLLRVETAMARQRFIFLLSLFSSHFFFLFKFRTKMEISKMEIS